LSAFPTLLRFPIALYVRLKEVLSSPFISLFILSDGCYQHQLSYLRDRFVVAENKPRKRNVSGKRKTNTEEHKTTLLFSGTMAESTGIFTAINLVEKLHGLNPSIHLTIVGYCSKRATLSKIKKAVAGSHFIQLVGGEHHVSHTTIINHIYQADFGIIAYPPNVATHDKFPTKLFEYLEAQLPIILTPNPLLESFCESYGASINVNPDSLDPGSLLQEMKQRMFYTTPPGEEILWETESSKVLQAIDQI
jgi:glycosyltransferase involved in cell wall biosynthesis